MTLSYLFVYFCLRSLSCCLDSDAYVGRQVEFALRLSSVSIVGHKGKGVTVVSVSDYKEQTMRYRLKFKTAIVIVISPIGIDKM